MKFELAIFDLDGTVLDTLNDLSAAVNHALLERGLPKRTSEEIRRFVGNGVAKLVERAVPAYTPEEIRAELLENFKAYYSAHMNDSTRPYPGIADMLNSLRCAGVRVGINSNKFDEALQKLCRLHFDGLCDAVIGESALTPRKPDPTAALRMMRTFGVSPEHTVYIGDSAVDIATARNAGCAAAWVAWGFRRREEMDDLDGVVCLERVYQLQDWLLE